MRVRAAPSGRSDSGGKRAKLILMPPSSGRLGDVFEVARLLVRAGVSIRGARKAVDDLADGVTTFVNAPAVTHYTKFKNTLMSQKVAVYRILRRSIDVKSLRARLGISQEAFAGRYGLDVRTVRNWEQGRTTPEGPAATLLQLIDRDPEKIVELLAS